jgi:hypothetical protein
MTRHETDNMAVNLGFKPVGTTRGIFGMFSQDALRTRLKHRISLALGRIGPDLRVNHLEPRPVDVAAQ